MSEKFLKASVHELLQALIALKMIELRLVL